MLAARHPGLELASGDYKPEPDVGLIDADFGAGQRFVEKAYLLAEIVFGTDDIQVPGTHLMAQWLLIRNSSGSAMPWSVRKLPLAAYNQVIVPWPLAVQ